MIYVFLLICVIWYGKIERFWGTFERSKSDESPFLEQISDLINEYNNVWYHSALTKFNKIKKNPHEYWSKSIKWVQQMPNFNK